MNLVEKIVASKADLIKVRALIHRLHLKLSELPVGSTRRIVVGNASPAIISLAISSFSRAGFTVTRKPHDEEALLFSRPCAPTVESAAASS